MWGDVPELAGAVAVDEMAWDVSVQELAVAVFVAVIVGAVDGWPPSS